VYTVNWLIIVGGAKLLLLERAVAPQRIESGGTRPNVRSTGKNCFSVVPLYFFGSKGTISRFGDRFRDDHYSLFSFLFAVLLTVPLCPAICKSGEGHVPPMRFEVGATGTSHKEHSQD